MSRLIVYDTSNFIDFPIGGQLTSISHFLRYLCEKQSRRVDDILLVGVCTGAEEVGKLKKIKRYGKEISFFPVAVAERDLGNTGKSLRLQYMKGLFKYGRQLKIKKSDCNYIHAPEACGAVRLLCPGAAYVIFSHGSYFNMLRGFRFYRGNLLVDKLFPIYLHWILRGAQMIFTLDKDSMEAYQPYQSNLVMAGNSILFSGEREGKKMPPEGAMKQVLFVGRLSKDKRVEAIIEAIERMPEFFLTIVGDGEEYHHLSPRQGDRIRFVGAVPPGEVSTYMKAADVLVMNSSFEGVPMTILEALSFGLPVVSTNVGGIGSALRFGEDSEESDGTPEGIQSAIEKIFLNYELYALHALQNAEAFDYLAVNQRIYQFLKMYWN